MQSAKVNEIFAYTTELFGPNPPCELRHTTDIDLLVAIVLSAQCTDKRVNMVTDKLFKKYKTVHDYAAASQAELENDICSINFFRNKAKNIIGLAKTVVGRFDGKIPATIEELTCLPGVGRKTASVFLSEFYKIPALAVDTHVMRVSRRLGLSHGKNPLEIERDLSAVFDRNNWCDYHLYMVLFGRYHCTAKNPRCADCKIKSNCEYKANF